jgi:hypothetical protein
VKRLILLAITCYSLQDVRNEGCKALCKRDGYDKGSEIKGECVCQESKGAYDDYTHRRITIPRGWNEQGSLSVTPSKKFIDHDLED